MEDDFAPLYLDIADDHSGKTNRYYRSKALYPYRY